MQTARLKLHERRGDTTPFIIASNGRSSVINGILSVMRLKSQVFAPIPGEPRYIHLGVSGNLVLNSFLWVWHYLNGLEEAELPQSIPDRIRIWTYLSMFGVDPGSEVVYRYLKLLDESLRDLSSFPVEEREMDELLVIMTDMLRRVPEGNLPPPLPERKRDDPIPPDDEKIILDTRLSMLSMNGVDKLYFSLARSAHPLLLREVVGYNYQTGLFTPVSMVSLAKEEVPAASYGSYGEFSVYPVIVLTGANTMDAHAWKGNVSKSMGRPDIILAVDMLNGFWAEYVLTRIGGKWFVRRMNRRGEQREYNEMIITWSAQSEEPLERLIAKMKDPHPIPLSKVIDTIYLRPYKEGTLYHIGRQKYPVYGNVVVMSGRSPTIASFYGDKTSEPWSGRRDILSEHDVDWTAFIQIWAYLNGQDDTNISFLNRRDIKMWELIGYFSLMGSSIVDNYLFQAGRTLDRDVTASLMRGIPAATRAGFQGLQPPLRREETVERPTFSEADEDWE